MNRLLLFATLAEADASIRKYGAKQLSAHEYQFSQGTIVVCGLGSYAAMRAMYLYAKEHAEIINLGIAGALSEKVPLSSLHRIHTVGKYTHLPQDIDAVSGQMAHLPQIALHTQGTRLVTCDFPLYHQPLRDQLALEWDLIDMEGYGVAYAAHSLGRKAQLWKIVSDFASEGGREMIKKNIKYYSEQLAEELEV